MDRLRRIIKWFFVGTAVLLLLVVAAVVIYSRSEHFSRWLREEAVATVNRTIRGSVSVERLEGSVWRDVTLHNVALRYENVEVLTIPRVAISFSLWHLLWNELQISQIDAFEPRASLNQEREGRWNVIEALGPRDPRPEQSSEFTTVIRSLRLRDAGIDLHLAGQEGRVYRLQNLALEGGLGILPDGVSLEARELAGGLLAKGLPKLQLKGAMDYKKMAAAPATLKIKEFWAVSANSRVRVNGEITHQDTTKLKAHFLLEKLAPADLRYFVADWPLKPDLAGSAAVEGSFDDLRGDLNLVGAGAKLAGKFRVDTEQDPLGYSVAMQVSGFDLRQWLGKKQVAGVLAGTLDARGRGFSLHGTVAKTRFEVRGAQIETWSLGTVAIDVKLENSIAVLDGKAEGNLGSAKWSGKIGLKEKRPTYDLALAFKDFIVEKAVPNAANVKGKLNFDGTVKGAGVSLADMNTRAEMRILPSQIGALNLEKGQIDAVLRDRKIFISSASLNAADSMLVVNGELGLEAKSSGKLDYRFRANNVAPWLSLFDQKGSGSLNLAGQAQGSLADLQTQGSARFSDLRLDGAAVRSGDVKFAVRGSKDQIFPEGLVTFRLDDVDAGVMLRRVDGKAAFLRSPAQAIQLDLNAQDTAARKHALNGTVNISPDLVALRLNQIALAAPDGVWKLARPATVTKKNQVFFVEQLSLRNSDRQVALEGRLSLSGAQDLQLTVDRLPLQSLSALMSQPPKMSGVINMTARISGTAAAPEITSSLKLNDPTIAGQAYAGASAEIHYKERAAAVRMTVQQDTTHSLTANGTLPYVLSWHEKFRAEPAKGMDIRMQSDGLSVAFLNAFAGNAVGNIGGDIALDVRARGSIKQPDLRGTFRLRDGSLKVVPLNVDVNALTISGGLDSGQLIVRDISAKAKDGEIRGSGSLALKQFDVSAVKLSLTAQRWPAIDTVQYQIRIAGNIDVEGSLVAPAVKGQIVVTEGSLRPDLNFLQQGKAPTKRDETIVVIRSDGAQGQTAEKNGAKEDSDLFKNLALDLGLRAPGNLWVRHPDLIAELSGNIKVSKARQRNIDLSGHVDVVRGSFAFQGRRFQLVRGTVAFTGGDKINPSLDIVAQYRVPNYQVEAQISGSVEKPALALTSQPPLEQADILAVILFGKPLNTLNQNEQATVGQSAIDLASGFVAGSIAISVAKALGLESLGFDEIDFSGGRIGLGRYIGSKTRIAASQQLTEEHRQEVTLEYEFAPDWKIGTSASSTGDSGIDIIWHKRY
jgi:autotransporter translocation and assembly factor TamB